MATLLLQLDDEMARAIKRVAPKRQRTRFIRLAIMKALMSLDELKTRKAYERIPQGTPDKWSSRPRRSMKK
jgi:hypothetical protein